MLISKLLDNLLPDVSYKTVAEREVNTLGFLSSTEKDVCVFIGAKKFLKHLPKTASMAIVPPELEAEIDTERLGCIVVEQPRQFFWRLHQAMDDGNGLVGPLFDSQISDTASVSPLAWVSPHNVSIGKNVMIEPFVTIYPNTTIEDGCTIRSGSRIGGVGFMEVRFGDQIETINHYGGVILHEGVDIHCNCCIDRGLFPNQKTEIGAYCKLDNMVHIAHSVRLGVGCMLAANSVVAGFTDVGEEVWIGPGVTVKNDIKIGNTARLNIGGVVVRSVEAGQSVSGNYAIDHDLFLYRQIELRRKA